MTAVSGDPGAPAREATITPYVSFASLDLVGIVLAAPRADPRDALLPAAQRSRPETPSPTPEKTP